MQTLQITKWQKQLKCPMRNAKKKRYLQKVIITFLSLILNLSNFKFNCKPYLQTMGCTMIQSVLHPTQTSLWQISKQNTSLHTLKTCFCYTLDILIWKGTKSRVNNIHKRSNWKTQTIKFDFQVSPRKIAFIDAMLYKDESNNIQTTLYRKPKDLQAFSHAKSEQHRAANL